MMTISLCMIVRNEEETLPRCLDSVGDVVDEIIIVDTGSTDGTKAAAAAYTQKIFDFPWIQDFSAARNFAFDQATMEYQLWLDADDILPPQEREKLRRLKETLDSGVDLVTMKYQTHFDEAGNPILISTRERLVKRSKGYRWQDPIHEYMPMSGNILHSDIVVVHQKPPTDTVSTRNLLIYESIEYKDPLTPRQEYYFARELMDHGQHAKALYYFGRFLDGGRGWSEDCIAACYAMARCHRALGRREDALPVLLRSFTYGSPRAEICSQVGYHYQARREFAAALEWFKFAAGLAVPDTMGFFLNRYWHYVPNLEAGVCCYHLGDITQANWFNEQAAKDRPQDPAVLNNRQLYQAQGADRE